jgi:hypothetical protein
VRVRVGGRVGARAVNRALAIASALDSIVLDTGGLVAADAAGRGPDGRDVLAGRATVVEALRTRRGVPVVGWDGAVTSTERAILARRVEREAGTVVIVD